MSALGNPQAATNLAQLQNTSERFEQKIQEVINAASSDIEQVAGLTQATAVTFARNDWARDVQAEEGVQESYTLTIGKNLHKRKSAAFFAQVKHIVEGAALDTWAAAGTRTSYNAETGDITLTSNVPFDGTATFLG